MSRSTKQLPFRQRFLHRILPQEWKDKIKKGLAPISEYLFERKAVVREPKYNYVTIYNELVKSWVFRQVSRAITQEVMNSGVELKKKFVMKCDNCLMEYETEVENCRICEGTSFTTPDIDQRKKAQNLMDNPNSEYSFEDLLRSALQWHIMLDDVYLSVAYKEFPRRGEETDETGEKKMVVKEVKTPAEVFVEDTRFTLPVSDEFGKLGNNQYFCPKCYDYKLDNFVVPNEDGSIPDCEECGGPMLQTCYIMRVGNTIRQRYGCEEIVMDNSDATKPELHGNPKAVSVWKLFKTINNMDDYKEEVYREGGVGGIIAFPGMSQPDLSKMKKKMMDEIATANKRDATTGQRLRSKKIHVLFVATKEGGEPTFIPALPDADQMDSLDTYKLYRDSICAVYGVTPIFVGVIESGKSGNNPRMQIDVQKGTTIEHQSFLEDLWNNKVLPLFDVTDWVIEFGAVEAVDELRLAQVWERRASAAKTLTALGFNVTFDEHGNLEVSLEADEESQEEQPEESEETEEPRQEDVSEESGDWLMPPKRDNEFPDEAAAKIRQELEREFLKIINRAKKVGDAKKSYAQAKKIMDRVFPELVEAARVSLNKRLKIDLPKLPEKPMRVLRNIRNEQMRDMRKLINLELKRKK